MASKLYWIDGGWPGKLAIAARPRGGDWLEDELVEWSRAGVSTLVSLLTRDEEQSLGLHNEAALAKSQGMGFVSFPIADRQVPSSPSLLAEMLEKIGTHLSSGKDVLIHCRQGVGRSGLVAACLLITKGWNPSAAVEQVSAARGVAIPETAEQGRWIEHYAASLAGTK
jgi:protein-tyrosine phosphatase